MCGTRIVQTIVFVVSQNNWGVGTNSQKGWGHAYEKINELIAFKCLPVPFMGITIVRHVVIFLSNPQQEKITTHVSPHVGNLSL